MDTKRAATVAITVIAVLAIQALLGQLWGSAGDAASAAAGSMRGSAVPATALTVVPGMTHRVCANPKRAPLPEGYSPSDTDCSAALKERYGKGVRTHRITSKEAQEELDSIRNEWGGAVGTIPRSQEGEDIYVAEALFQLGPNKQDGMRRGTYIELGALDGVRFSNTRLFHHGFGWNGLQIDASPPNFAKLVQNRPRDYNVNAGICAEPGTFTIWGEGPVADSRGEDPRSSTAEKRKSYTVECNPISKYEYDAGITKVDFFSIDVEGHEWDVVSTHDWERVAVSALILELNDAFDNNEVQMRQLLWQNGMCRFSDAVGHKNEVWINEDQYSREQPHDGQWPCYGQARPRD